MCWFYWGVALGVLFHLFVNRDAYSQRQRERAQEGRETASKADGYLRAMTNNRDDLGECSA